MFRATLRRVLEAHWAGLQGGTEVEVRLGHWAAGKFQPGVPEQAYKSLLEYMGSVATADGASAADRAARMLERSDTMDVLFSDGVRVRCEHRSAGSQWEATGAMRKVKHGDETLRMSAGGFDLRVGVAEETELGVAAQAHKSSAVAALASGGAAVVSVPPMEGEVEVLARVRLDNHNCYSDRDARDPLLHYARQHKLYLPPELARQVRWMVTNPAQLHTPTGDAVPLHSMPPPDLVSITCLPGEIEVPEHGRHAFPLCWYSGKIGAEFVRPVVAAAAPAPAGPAPQLFRAKERTSLVGPHSRLDVTCSRESPSGQVVGAAPVYEVEVELTRPCDTVDATVEELMQALRGALAAAAALDDAQRAAKRARVGEVPAAATSSEA